MGTHSSTDFSVGLDGGVDAMASQSEHVRERGIGMGQRGGIGHGGGHIANAGVNYTFDVERRIGECRWSGSFNASAVVNGHIHDDFRGGLDGLPRYCERCVNHIFLAGIGGSRLEA